MAISIILHQWWYQYHCNHLPQLPINHFPLVSFTGLSGGGSRIPVHEDKWVIKPTAVKKKKKKRQKKYNNLLPFVPVCHSMQPYFLIWVSQHGHRLKCDFFFFFPPSGRDAGASSHGGILTVGVARGEGKERLMCNTFERGGLSILLCQGALLTWGNICCIEIETDDSNYVPSEGLPVWMWWQRIWMDGLRKKGMSSGTRQMLPSPRSYVRWKCGTSGGR